MATTINGATYYNSSATSKSATAASSTSSSSSGKTTLDQDAFMKMLLAQIQRQDPLNPMDSTQFAAQLAQFTTVEQISNLNTKMTTMIEKLSNSVNAQMLNLIGKEAVVRGDALYVQNGTATQGSFTMSLDATAQVNIYNSSGSLVRTINLGQKSANEMVRFNWDGANSYGLGVEDGAYSFTVTATRSDDQTPSVTTYASGTITAYKTDSSGNPLLVVNNQLEVPYANVIEVKLPTTTGTTADAQTTQ